MDAHADAGGHQVRGTIAEGIRTIELPCGENVGEIAVYRGETVRLRWPAGCVWAAQLSLPSHQAQATTGDDGGVSLQFKASEEGRFPLYGQPAEVPAGQVVVIPFAVSEAGRFVELSAEQAKQRIEQGNIFVLDVRTPREFEAVHLPGAALIPVEELEGRIDELPADTSTPILIYCRSGNRSTVAAQVLIEHGYRNLLHLRYGIREWVGKGFDTGA